MELVTLRELALATRGRLQDVVSDAERFDRVSTDSREVKPGDVFWSLKGDNHDGHDFVAQALSQRARLCVVSQERSPQISGPQLIVEDTLAALGRFASWYRSRIDSLIIGITGSVGKTTTRELIYSGLAAQFQGIRSRKNFNNLIGLPLSLLDLESRHEFAVLEMGAARIGDIRDLCHLAHPEVGVITAIGPAHLESFGSLEAIIQAKGELLEQLPRTGFAVLPGDELVTRQMADRAMCPVISVGIGEHNQIRASRVETYAGGVKFRCEGCDFDVPMNGQHYLVSALCAIAIGLELGVPPRRLAAGLSSFRPTPGRGGMIQIGPWTVIDDSYNASPLSVAAACRMLREAIVPKVGNRILILGDMRELGETAATEHERIGCLAANLRLDRVLAYGKFAESVAAGARRSGMMPHQIAATENIDAMQAVLDCWLEPRDLLLVKGSRVMQMEQTIEWLKTRAREEKPLPEFSHERICA